MSIGAAGVLGLFYRTNSTKTIFNNVHAAFKWAGTDGNYTTGTVDIEKGLCYGNNVRFAINKSQCILDIGFLHFDAQSQVRQGVRGFVVESEFLPLKNVCDCVCLQWGGIDIETLNWEANLLFAEAEGKIDDDNFNVIPLMFNLKDIPSVILYGAEPELGVQMCSIPSTHEALCCEKTSLRVNSVYLERGPRLVLYGKGKKKMTKLSRKLVAELVDPQYTSKNKATILLNGLDLLGVSGLLIETVHRVKKAALCVKDDVMFQFLAGQNLYNWRFCQLEPPRNSNSIFMPFSKWAWHEPSKAAVFDFSEISDLNLKLEYYEDLQLMEPVRITYMAHGLIELDHQGIQRMPCKSAKEEEEEPGSEKTEKSKVTEE